MKIVNISDPTFTIKDGSSCQDPIHIFTQFFIHRDQEREREIKFCLKQMVENPDVHQIHLLGEREYSSVEMGISSNKIIQTVIGRRLKFQDVFVYIREKALSGYHIMVNSDIAFDLTALPNLRKSDIHLIRKTFALLRFEYNAKNPKQSRIFGPRSDSQDTWIFHANFPVPEHSERAFGFEFGKPGCDNKMIYLANILGYKVINDPHFIITYHVHASPARDYTIKDVVHAPWGLVVPANVNPLSMPATLGINMHHISATTNNFQDLHFEDNDLIYEYISSKIAANCPFVIPQITGLANNFAVFGQRCEKGESVVETRELIQYLNQNAPNNMLEQSSVRLSGMHSMYKYAAEYLKVFEYCDLMCGWNVHDPMFGQISQSHEHIKRTFG